MRRHPTRRRFKGVNTPLIFAFAWLVPAPAGAELFVIQGEKGNGLDCDGTTCTLDSALAVDADIDVAHTASADAADFGNTLIVSSPEAAACPDGYAIANEPSPYVICRKTLTSGAIDEMVKVGDYWIDKYEASVWDNPGCVTRQYGKDSDDWAPPDDGNWSAEKTGYACSLADVYPTRYMTWFQAQQSCRASGKSLCSNAEWQAAAYGTPDPSTAAPCNVLPPNDAASTKTNGTVRTGSATGCISGVGANDMVGNLSEWVADWMQGGPTFYDEKLECPGLTVWPETYYSDLVWCVNGVADRTGNGDFILGLPAAMVRGGAWTDNTAAGVYAASLEYGPSATSARIGARCCLR